MNGILKVIEDRSGIVLKDARLSRTEAFITTLLEQGAHTYNLEKTLQEESFSHSLWQQIIQQITVGETYFFRNRPHFDALRQRVLPNLIQQRRRQKQLYLRLWIAGCATGEEAYSIAMLLQDLLPDIANWSIFLLATDINLAFLEFAQRGVYRERAFRSETPPGLQARFFSKTPDGYRISPTVHKMVMFSSLNLTEPIYPSLGNNTTSLDLILCRNVTIYFDRSTTRQIASRLHDALRPSGWLLVGHSEPQSGVYDAFTTQNINGAIFYQKPVEPAPQREVVRQPEPEPVTPPAPELTAAVAFDFPVPNVEEDMPTDKPLLIAQQAADNEDWQTALEILEDAEPTDRFNPLLHYIRGLVYTHLDQPTVAVQSFRQAVYCEPDFALAHYAIGELLLQLGKEAQAVASWKRARKTLNQWEPNEPVLGAEDLTAEMLCELVDYRLQTRKAT